MRVRWNVPLLVGTLLLMASCGSAAEGLYTYNEDIAEIHQEMILTEEYGVDAEMIARLRSSGLGWEEIKEKLAAMYPKTHSWPVNADYIRLRAATGIEPIQGVRAYQLAMAYRRSPEWLALLYNRGQDWDRIERALARREVMMCLIISGIRRQVPWEEQVRAIADFYNMKQEPLRRALSQGIDIETLLGLLFLVDAVSDIDISEAPLEITPLPDDWTEVYETWIAPIYRIWVNN